MEDRRLQEPRTSKPAPARRLLHGDLDIDDELVVGRGMAYLLLRTRDWVHRRVELIRFLDADNVQRQMSVDFTMPLLSNRSVAEMTHLVGTLVPLSMLSKDRLKRFSVWDEEGSTVPMLTSRENARLAGACLVSMATDAWREHVDDQQTHLPGELAEALRHIAAAPPATSRFILSELQHRPERLAERLGAAESRA